MVTSLTAPTALWGELAIAGASTCNVCRCLNLQTVTLSSRSNSLSMGSGYGDLDHFFVAVNVPLTMPPISILPCMVFFSTVPS